MFADNLSPSQVFEITISTDGLDMEAMGTALNDITNGANTSAPAKNEEAHALAREKGWVEPQEYDYGAYTGSRDPAGDCEVIWSHNAEKYEWKEEYGEVGPESQALEAQLFRSEIINRQGLKFDK